MEPPRPLTNPHKNELNVGIIGYGMATRVFHVPFIKNCPGLRVHSIVQWAPAPTGRLRNGQTPHVAIEHPDVRHYRRNEDLLADEEVDLVVVATPTPGHYGIVKSALSKDKHVLVEKPFCPTSAECDELIHLAKERKRILSVFHNRRLDADFITLTTLLADAKVSQYLTPVVDFVSHYDRYQPKPPTGWKATLDPGTGILYDLGSHLIDQALVLFGLPDWVSAVLSNQLRTDPLDIDDAFTLLLYYDAIPGRNGGKPMQVELKSSMLSVAERQLRFRCRGWKGSWTKQHVDAQEEQLKEHGIRGPTLPGYGSELPSNFGTLVTVDAIDAQSKETSMTSSELELDDYNRQSSDSADLDMIRAPENQLTSENVALHNRPVLFMDDRVRPNDSQGQVEGGGQGDVDMLAATESSQPYRSGARSQASKSQRTASSSKSPSVYASNQLNKYSSATPAYRGGSNDNSPDSFESSITTPERRDRDTGFYIFRTPAARGDYVTFYRNMYYVLSLVKFSNEDVAVAANELLVKPEQARDVIRIIELAKDSHREGRRIPVV